MIKAVLFDYGGVLTESGAAGSLAQLYGKLYGLKAEEVQGFSLRSKWIRGNISDDEFFAGLNSLYPDKTPVNAKKFLKYSSGIFIRSKPVHELAAKLRRKGVRTGILSDVVPVAANEHKKRGDYKVFNPVLLSCAEGTAKPDIEFYKRALIEFNLPANEVLYIDDKETNLKPAHQLGMHTILAKFPMQIVRDVSQLIKRENGIDLDS